MPTTDMPSTDTLAILLVEDNDGDVLLFREAAEAAGLKHELRVVTDGTAAVEVIHQYAGADQPHRPDLIVLDLNLPGCSGREILEEMTNLPALWALPVAVLTTSASEAGIGADFPELRVDFAAKTPHFRDLVEIVNRFARFAGGAGGR
jgi:CheY-like chemotaxis protein